MIHEESLIMSRHQAKDPVGPWIKDKEQIFNSRNAEIPMEMKIFSFIHS